MTDTRKMAFLRSIATHANHAQEQVDNLREFVSGFPVTPEVYDRISDALENLARADDELARARVTLLDAYAELTALQLEREHDAVPRETPPSATPQAEEPAEEPELVLVVKGVYDDHGLEGFRRTVAHASSPAGDWRVSSHPLIHQITKNSNGQSLYEHSACSDWPAAPYPPTLTEDELMVYKDGRKLEGRERAEALNSLVRESAEDEGGRGSWSDG